MNNYATIVTVRAPRNRLVTANLFDATYADTGASPVDQFLENSVLLNSHWAHLPAGQQVAPELSRLLLIGYASAVEGYMRSLIRRLVNVDRHTQELCAKLQVSFAAATHHSREQLPDALLEETSFSSEEVIPKTLVKYIGFHKLSGATEAMLKDFDLLMQLRHCCTHRFGKLGVKNATALGLKSHHTLLEKPVKLDNAAMGDIADLAFSLVKSINNDVFGFVMGRTVTSGLGQTQSTGIPWTWNIARDRSRFKRYHEIFCSTMDATPSLGCGDVYRLFRTAYKNARGNR